MKTEHEKTCCTENETKQKHQHQHKFEYIHQHQHKHKAGEPCNQHPEHK
ncbi:hypothetical protein [Shewanella marina]|nr:hypothetical protein [Shewanella marina]